MNETAKFCVFGVITLVVNAGAACWYSTKIHTCPTPVIVEVEKPIPPKRQKPTPYCYDSCTKNLCVPEPGDLVVFRNTNDRPAVVVCKRDPDLRIHIATPKGDGTGTYSLESQPAYVHTGG